jgi:hypothetical protein
MKVAIVDKTANRFLCTNGRFYQLKRSERRPPSPHIFKSKEDAKDFLRLNILEDPKITYEFIKPEQIKIVEPRKASVRRYTCGGRK